MNLEEVFTKLNNFGSKAKSFLFSERIESKKVLFERKHKRKMGEDEIKSYAFSLFTIYAITLTVPIILLFAWMKS